MKDCISVVEEMLDKRMRETENRMRETENKILNGIDEIKLEVNLLKQMVLEGFQSASKQNENVINSILSKIPNQEELKEFRELVIEFQKFQNTLNNLVSNPKLQENSVDFNETIQIAQKFDKIIKILDKHSNELEVINHNIMEVLYKDVETAFNEVADMIEDVGKGITNVADIGVDLSKGITNVSKGITSVAGMVENGIIGMGSFNDYVRKENQGIKFYFDYLVEKTNMLKKIYENTDYVKDYVHSRKNSI